MELPRTYVIERIKARMLSIAREGVGDATAIAAGDARERDLVLDWLADLADAARDVVAAAVARDDDLRNTDIAPDDLVTRARSINTKLPGAPNTDGWARSVTDVDNELFADRKRATDRLTAGVKEGNALEHALVYLEGTPVDTFTKTDLRDLGLLDVVKFKL